MSPGDARPAFQLRIRAANTEKYYALDKEQTTIGCDASADICLTGELSLGAQHILLAPRDQACWLSTRAGAPVRLAGGEPLEAGFLPWGSRFALGGIEFALQGPEIAPRHENDSNRGPAVADTGGEQGKTSSSRRAGPQPIVLMLLIATLAYTVWPSKEQRSPAIRVEAPELFASPARECSSPNAEHRALLMEEAGDAKSERSVFEPQDGITAVSMFREAAACYRAARLPVEGERAEGKGETLAAQLEEQYYLLRFRLRNALASGDYESARYQVSVLSQLLQHKAGTDYGLALRSLRLSLTK